MWGLCYPLSTGYAQLVNYCFMYHSSMAQFKNDVCRVKASDRSALLLARAMRSDAFTLQAYG